VSPAVMVAAAVAAGAASGWAAHAAWARQAVRGARRDPVTGLLTRYAWTAQARRLLRRRGTRTIALIDLDRFKEVNDSYGHAAGDELLARTAVWLAAWTASVGGGSCGRLGGDEFVIITCRQVTAAETGDLAAGLQGPLMLSDTVQVQASASVGTAACSGPRALSAGIAAADAAMYEAKRGGGGYRIGCHVPPAAKPAKAPRRRTRHHGPAEVPFPPAGTEVSGGRCAPDERRRL